MSITEQVIEILKELSGKKAISKSDTLQGALGLDSFGMVTLLLEIEDVFSITLDESDMNPFDLLTVEDVTGLVKKYKGGCR